jgi:O-succinylbenzoate synthase
MKTAALSGLLMVIASAAIGAEQHLRETQLVAAVRAALLAIVCHPHLLQSLERVRAGVSCTHRATSPRISRAKVGRKSLDTGSVSTPLGSHRSG